MRGNSARSAWTISSSREEQGDGGAVVPMPSDRTLRSISGLGSRANERAAEADAEFRSHDRKHGCDNGGSSSSKQGHIQGQAANDSNKGTKAIEELLGAINASLTGSGGTAKLVKRDEPIVETVAAHTSNCYRVILPHRPTAITVTVTRTGGGNPTLWGSTSCTRPNARNHEFRGEDDKIYYEHALSNNDDSEEAALLDRRKDVPPCRELFVTIEAETGECTCRILVTFGRIKIVLSRSEIAAQVAKMRRGWEAKLAETQKDPLQREMLEERVKTLKIARAKELRVQHREMNYLDRNARIAAASTPRALALKNQNKALLEHEHHHVIASRREQVEQEREQKKVEWMNRSEVRKRLREEKELELKELEQLAVRQHEWICRMSVVTFAYMLGARYLRRHEVMMTERRRIASARIIEQYVMRAISWKRRRDLYRNVIMLRTAVGAYVRMTQPAAANMAQPALKHFLAHHHFNKEMPTVRGAVAQFRARVKTIQRFWLRRMTVRSAYVTIFMSSWLDAEAKVHNELLKSAAAALPAAASAKRQPAPGKRSPPSELDPPWIKMPTELVTQLLSEYIGEMQRSFPRRIREYEEHAQEAAFDADLEGFVGDGRQGSRLRPRPRCIYADFNELERFVRAKIELWRSTGFKAIKNDRKRIMRPSFDAWAKLLRCAWLRADGSGNYDGASALQGVSKANMEGHRRSSAGKKNSHPAKKPSLKSAGTFVQTAISMRRSSRESVASAGSD